MSKYLSGDIVQIVSDNKYNEMFGIVNNVESVAGEWLYDVFILPGNDNALRFKEAELSPTEYSDMNILGKINKYIADDKGNHPGIGSVMYEDFTAEGYLVDNLGYYFEKYYGESVKNDLPPWEGEIYNFYEYQDYLYHREGVTLPHEVMKQIINKHSFRKRSDIVVGYIKISKWGKAIMKELGMHSEGEMNHLLFSIHCRIRLINGVTYMNEIKDPYFTGEELKLIEKIDWYDKYGDKNHSVNHFPYYMSDMEIMQAIKDAYENAEKTDEFMDGHRVYKGCYKNKLYIKFIYDFANACIITAYPA